MEKKTKVSLVKGDERYANVRKALELIADDIYLGQRILIKPNFTSVTRQLAATHVDAVRATLDFLAERTSAQITIAEGSGTGSASTMVGFRKFGYFPLGERYNIRFLDLNADEVVTTQILNSRLKPITIRLAKTVVDSDYRISICPPKTHDCVIFTASLKNLLMGAVVRKEKWVTAKFFSLANLVIGGVPVRTPGWLAKASGNDKVRVHQGYPAMNLNLYKLAWLIPPHLSVIDGFQAMEGDGPVDGDEVKLGVALASVDFLACDTVAAWLMGFDISQIGYLSYCHRVGLGEGDISRIEVVGEKMADCVQPFRPHHSYDEQLKWRIAKPERYLD